MSHLRRGTKKTAVDLSTEQTAVYEEGEGHKRDSPKTISRNAEVMGLKGIRCVPGNRVGATT